MTPDVQEWLTAVSLRTERLTLQPLQAEHADELAALLYDPDLYTFIGGRAATIEQLRGTYAAQAAGRSPDGSAGWLNWVVRSRLTGEPLGVVQTTLTRRARARVAEVAWMIGPQHQGHGYARESVGAMVAWLRRSGIRLIIAHIHPDNLASMAVARAVGLVATDTVSEGEVRWEG
jgi:RimJ/RimL family protein N-acetyltransferase